MALFAFKALDKDNTEASGTLEASDRQSALETLSRKYELVIEVKAVKSRKCLFSKGVRTEEVMVVTQQLAIMLKAGLPLKQALDVLDTETPELQAIIGEISSGIGEGKPLSEMFERHPHVFNSLYTSMVRAGEAAGKLPGLLMKLAEYLEGAENLRRKVVGALTYPVAVICIAFLIAVFIFIFGVKQFQDIYAGLNTPLPPLTKLTIGAADILFSYWYLLVMGGAALFYGARSYCARKKGELVRDRLLLTLPVIGPLMQRLAIARFARTLSTLYAGGVPILTSLDLVASSMGNRVMENVVRKTLKDVKEGESLVKPLRESKVFTRMTISMIASGEESGTLDVMLEEVADFYEIQVEILLRSLASLLEPIVIVGVGIFVAVLILALGLPLLNLVQVLG